MRTFCWVQWSVWRVRLGLKVSGQVGLRSELGLSLGPVWGALLTIRLSAYHRQHCPCIASVVQLTYQHLNFYELSEVKKKRYAWRQFCCPCASDNSDHFVSSVSVCLTCFPTHTVSVNSACSCVKLSLFIIIITVSLTLGWDHVIARSRVYTHTQSNKINVSDGQHVSAPHQFIVQVHVL